MLTASNASKNYCVPLVPILQAVVFSNIALLSAPGGPRALTTPRSGRRVAAGFDGRRWVHGRDGASLGRRSPRLCERVLRGLGVAHIVLGEQVPKIVALQYEEPGALYTTKLTELFMRACWAFIKTFNWITNRTLAGFWWRLAARFSPLGDGSADIP